MNAFRKFARKVAKEALCVSLQGLSYVDRSLRCDDSLEWLFVLTMPNSGSTALSKVLMTAEATVSLSPRCEGEWLVPSLSNPRKRWLEAHSPSMDRIRARWMAKLRSSANGQPRLVVEKSPSNMVRIDQLRAVLAPMKTSSIILVRDPYAVCEGWHRRYGREGLSKTSMPELIGVSNDQEYFELLGARWVRHATTMANHRRKVCSIVRYEDFISDPRSILSKLSLEFPLLSSAKPDAFVEVKDYGLQRLRNMNDQQIAALGSDQVDAISSGLEQGHDVVKSFGYSLR